MRLQNIAESDYAGLPDEDQFRNEDGTCGVCNGETTWCDVCDGRWCDCNGGAKRINWGGETEQPDEIGQCSKCGYWACLDCGSKYALRGGPRGTQGTKWAGYLCKPCAAQTDAQPIAEPTDF